MQVLDEITTYIQQTSNPFATQGLLGGGLFLGSLNSGKIASYKFLKLIPIHITLSWTDIDSMNTSSIKF